MAVSSWSLGVPKDGAASAFGPSQLRRIDPYSKKAQAVGIRDMHEQRSNRSSMNAPSSAMKLGAA
ncbi:MAG: hypothetical protein OEM94_11760 [Acidimicrobiia bacterium]|nr:hypothetical protein [Acidimicrobiia bacterium]